MMKSVGEKCNLSELKIGQKAIVKKINITDKKIKRHLLDMGITRGVEIKIKKEAPMGDPINIMLRGYELAVRKADLKQIDAQVIK